MAVGTCIPLYSYPGADWTTVINAKNAHPNVPVTAIINPASGPGPSSDPNYVTGINNLKAAGIKVLGYVATGYGTKPIATAEAEIDLYVTWYAVNGIFFDEMQNVAGSETYYTNLTAYVKSHGGMTVSVGNPGTSTVSSYVGTVDMMFIYESGGQPTIALIDTNTFNHTYPKSNFGIIPYNVPSLDTTFVTNVSADVDWIYITDDTNGAGNPWDVLSTYFTALVAALDVGGTSTLTVETRDINNVDSPGFFIDSVFDVTTSTSVGGGVFTDHAFASLTTGDTFRVIVDDFGSNYISAASIGTFQRVLAGGGGAGQSTLTLSSNLTVAFTISIVKTFYLYPPADVVIYPKHVTAPTAFWKTALSFSKTLSETITLTGVLTSVSSGVPKLPTVARQYAV